GGRPAGVALSCFASSHMRASQDRDTEIAEAHPGFSRRHRHQRMPGHAGGSVHLEKLERSVRFENEIEPAPSAAADDLERGKRGGADLELLRLGEAARTEILRFVGEVL